MKRKCYTCRAEYKHKTSIFCRKCRKEREAGTLDAKGSSTLIIYDKI